MASSLTLSSAQSSDMTNVIEDWEVSTKNMDTAGSQKETKWSNTKASIYWGYFNSIPDLKSALLMKTIWNVGRGYETEDSRTKVVLDHIRGWGKDTFRDILFSLELGKRIFGDSFAEIIRDKETGTLINLKPLDPANVDIIVDPKGMIIRYEQRLTNHFSGKAVEIFQPEEILHFSNNRIGSQIHGISDIESMEDIIKADKENFEDLKKSMHRQVKPFILWKLKTDDTAKIAEVVAKIDAARNLGEDMFIPDDDDAIEYEVVQVNLSSVVLAWRDGLRNSFFRAIGLPQIVPGAGGQSTESESKVIYLAFEQLVEKDQIDLEEQIWNQLGLRINLIHPASLRADLAQDNAKDGLGGQINFQPNETQAGVGR